MPRPERPVDPGGGPAQRFAVALRELRRAAGNPTYRVLAKRAHYSTTTLAEAASGDRLPTLPVALAYARACHGDEHEWTDRWRAAATELEAAEPDPADSPPYPGLAAYGPQDADRFCGRDRLVAALRERLARQRFVAVVGASGSGKSSLVRAGLIPAVEAEGWPTVLMTPGAHPMREYAARYEHDDACVIVVDQFEEVFSLCEDTGERESFVKALLSAAHEPQSRTRVVIALRADFYAHCARLPDLVAALQDAQLLVGPMTPEELSLAITEPAAKAGLMVEKALVATIIAEAASRPAALPLVSHALWETWRRRRGTGLFLAGYAAAGGIDGAVAQSAERVYGELDDEHRRAARRILLRLIAPGDGTEDTRRRVHRAELGDDPVTAQVLQRLAAARLVTIGEHTVEIAHEALIRGWPTLRDWLAADRESLRAHHRLTAAAAEWAAHDHDDAFLYRGSQLAGWAERGTEAINDFEKRFLSAGTEREARESARHRRRLRTTIGALAAGLVTVSLLALLGVAQTLEANAQRDLAVAGGLAAQSRAMLATQPDLANLLALGGLGRATTDQTVASAQAALATPMHVARPLIGHAKAVTAVAFSPDGRAVATGSLDGAVRLWSSGGGDTLAVVKHDGGGVNALAFNGDGRILATGGTDGTVRLWDSDSHQPLGALSDDSAVNAVAFSPDGTLIATAHADGTVGIWDTRTRRSIGALAGHEGSAHAVAFSPDGRTLATAGKDNTARIWDPVTRQPIAELSGHTGEVFAVAFSPDGETLATGSGDGTARIWDAGSHQTTAILRGHMRVVRTVAFAADGRTIVTGSWDNTARLWSTATHQPLATLSGHTDQVLAAAVHPKGNLILTGGSDGTARLWETRARQFITTLEGHTDSVDSAAFSPDGRTVATGGRDGTARLWNAGEGSLVATLAVGGDMNLVYTVGFSPNGDTLATGHKDGTVRLWDTRAHREIGTLTGHALDVAAVAFSPDGQMLASGSTDGTARLWDVAKRQTVAILRGHEGWVDSVAFSPDGRTVATAATDGTARLWDARTGQTITTLSPGAGYLTALAFSPDGKTVATAAANGTVLLWHVASGHVAGVLTGHSAMVTSVAFSADGHTLATGSRDDTARLWDWRNRHTLVSLTGHTGWVTGVSFSPDGRTVATASWDHTARLTPMPEAWPGELCRRAGRNLTDHEWAFYVGPEPYRRLCPGLPAGQSADPAAPALPLPHLGP